MYFSWWKPVLQWSSQMLNVTRSESEPRLDSDITFRQQFHGLIITYFVAYKNILTHCPIRGTYYFVKCYKIQGVACSKDLIKVSSHCRTVPEREDEFCLFVHWTNGIVWNSCDRWEMGTYFMDILILLSISTRKVPFRTGFISPFGGNIRAHPSLCSTPHVSSDMTGYLTCTCCKSFCCTRVRSVCKGSCSQERDRMQPPPQYPSSTSYSSEHYRHRG